MTCDREIVRRMSLEAVRHGSWYAAIICACYCFFGTMTANISQFEPEHGPDDSDGISSTDDLHFTEKNSCLLLSLTFTKYIAMLESLA